MLVLKLLLKKDSMGIKMLESFYEPMNGYVLIVPMIAKFN